jgi:hypothetical protein
MVLACICRQMSGHCFIMELDNMMSRLNKYYCQVHVDISQGKGGAIYEMSQVLRQCKAYTQ